MTFRLRLKALVRLGPSAISSHDRESIYKTKALEE
jgi:hypothetical protein